MRRTLQLLAKFTLAAIHDDWDSVGHIFQADKEILRMKISRGATALYIAVETNRSHSFVEKIVEHIIIDFGVEALRIQNGPRKDTVLHRAARLGNFRATKLLVTKDPDMPRLRMEMAKHRSCMLL